MITLHKCSVPECTCMVKPHILMCRAHWRRVPYHFQSQVWAAWDKYRSGEISITELREVQDRATAAVFRVKGGAA